MVREREPERRKCVWCGTPGALVLFRELRCLNPSCRWYDRTLAPPPPYEDWRGWSVGGAFPGGYP